MPVLSFPFGYSPLSGSNPCLSCLLGELFDTIKCVLYNEPKRSTHLTFTTTNQPIVFSKQSVCTTTALLMVNKKENTFVQSLLPRFRYDPPLTSVGKKGERLCELYCLYAEFSNFFVPPPPRLCSCCKRRSEYRPRTGTTPYTCSRYIRVVYAHV